MATFIGIDIGNRYTKIIELECLPAAKLITDEIFRTQFLPVDQFGRKKLDTKFFWSKITSKIPLKRIKESKIGINIPSSSVMAMTLLLPRMTKRELSAVVQTEARRKMIPTSGPNHIFESTLIGGRIQAKVRRFEVLALRTDKFYVEQIVELFKEAEIIPKIITLSSCTLFTMFPPEVLSKKDVDVAFVDIGLNSINTSIFREGKLNFFRNTAFGLQDIIQDIGKHLSLSDNEVEDIIKEEGVSDVSVDLKDKVAVAEEIMKQKYEASLKATEANQKEEISLLELRILWQAHIERIIHELRRSLAYYKEQAEGRRVEYIYFLGGGCQIKNLIRLLTEQIGGQLQIILPFKNIELPKERESLNQANTAPIFTNAASLALSVATKVKGIEVINFLPTELKKKEIIATGRLVLRLSKIAFIFILCLFSVTTFVTNHSLRASIRGAEYELQGFGKIADRLKDLTQQQRLNEEETTQIQGIIKGRQNFYLLLSKLSAVIPREVLVTSISAGAQISQDEGAGGGQAAQQNKIQIKAQVFADYEKANKIIEDLRSNLGACVYFKNVDITPIKLEKITTQSSSGAGQELRLTQPKVRTFTVTADISGTS